MKAVALRLIAIWAMIVTIGLAVGSLMLIVAAVDFTLGEWKSALILVAGFLAGIAMTLTWIHHLNAPSTWQDPADQPPKWPRSSSAGRTAASSEEY